MTCKEGIRDIIFLVRNRKGGVTGWDEGKGVELFWFGLWGISCILTLLNSV